MVLRANHTDWRGVQSNVRRMGMGLVELERGGRSSSNRQTIECRRSVAQSIHIGRGTNQGQSRLCYVLMTSRSAITERPRCRVGLVMAKSGRM